MIAIDTIVRCEVDVFGLRRDFLARVEGRNIGVSGAVQSYGVVAIDDAEHTVVPADRIEVVR